MIFQLLYGSILAVLGFARVRRDMLHMPLRHCRLYDIQSVYSSMTNDHVNKDKMCPAALCCRDQRGLSDNVQVGKMKMNLCVYEISRCNNFL